MLEVFLSAEGLVALATLIGLEVVLGIDNIIFISILVGRLPEENRKLARELGIGFAMVSRLILLFCIYWIMGLVEPLFSVFEQDFSGRDIIIIVGGLFLLAKSTHEIHNSLEIPGEEESGGAPPVAGFAQVIVQIALLDIVFSLDSIITAVGLVEHISIMVVAIVVSVGVMLLLAKPISGFVDTHPTVKMLALSFLLMIGVTLIAEGLDMHIPKGYIYFAMAFSVGVEFLNITARKRRRRQPIHLAKKQL